MKKAFLEEGLEPSSKPLLEDLALIVDDSLDSGPIAGEKKYTIDLLCDHSIKKPNRFFSNFVSDRTTKSIVNSKINKTMNLHRKEKMEKELPFEIAETLKINDNNPLERLNDILTEYIKKPLQVGDEEVINVCWYKDRASGLNYKEKGNKLRVMYRLSDDDEKIEIILIDPNHTFATNNYKQYYSECENYQVDIKDIFIDYCELFN